MKAEHSGVVAALTQRGWLLVSIAYLQRAGFRARAKELVLVLLLERKLRKISTGKKNVIADDERVRLRKTTGHSSL